MQMQMRTDGTETTMSDRVLSNLSTAIIMLDDSMTVLFANQAAENLLQESYEQMRGRLLESTVCSSSELASMIASAFASDQIYTRREMNLFIPIKKEEITVDVTVTPILGTRNALVEFFEMDRYLRIDRDAALRQNHELSRQVVRGPRELEPPMGRQDALPESVPAFRPSTSIVAL